MSEGVDCRVGNIDQVPVNQGRTMLAGGRPVAVFHLRGGEVRATQALCPHRRGPLADGLVGDGRLVCPLHNRTFDLESGETTPDETGIVTFPARVEGDGTVIVTLPESGELPGFFDDGTPAENPLDQSFIADCRVLTAEV
ncbi:MAG: hypothetical protein NVS2B6_03720 [Thermoleophilaceae bacterium]